MLLCVPAYGALVYENTFDDGTFGDVLFSVECRSDQFELVQSPTYSPSYAIKTFQEQGQTCEQNNKQKARTEVIWESRSLEMPADQVSWAGWAFQLPAGTPSSQRHYVMQTFGDGAFSYRMLHDGSNWELQRTDASANTSIIWEDAVNYGSWDTFVMKLVPSNSSSGSVSFWYNGTLVVDNFTGSNYGAGSGVFIKTGPYLGNGAMVSITLYQDELRMGDSSSSFSEVDPRQSSPPASLPDVPTGAQVVYPSAD